MSRATSSKRNFERSGPSLSPIPVELTMSAKSTETTRRSPVITAMCELSRSRGMPRGGRNRPANAPRSRLYAGGMGCHALRSMEARRPFLNVKDLAPAERRSDLAGGRRLANRERRPAEADVAGLAEERSAEDDALAAAAAPGLV